MARNAKNTSIIEQKSRTKDEVSSRSEAERILRGELMKLEPSDRLNANQKKIFRHIIKNLDHTKILAILDEYFFEMGAIAIDRLQNIEKIINQDFDRIYDKELINAKVKYTADFNKFCQEACLSPASRAKMGLMIAQQKQEDKDPLLKVLNKKKSS